MNRIKEVLKDKGIKQVWLAEKLGKSYNMVNGYVTNKRQPSIEVLYEIAKLLQVESHLSFTPTLLVSAKDTLDKHDLMKPQ